MSGTQRIPAERLDAILEESIHQQLPTVLTHRTPNGWRAYKSTFASGSSESHSILVKAQIPTGTIGPAPPQPGETLGVTFRRGRKKCMFSSVLQSLTPQQNATLVGLCWPDRVDQVQRRAYERVIPPRGRIIAVRFWHEDAQSGDTPDMRNVRHGQLENISAGGMRLKVADPKDMEIGRTYRCAFSLRYGSPTLIIDATLRHRETGAQGRTSLGFQFIGLETSSGGRRTLDRLARIVSRFQRAKGRTNVRTSKRRKV